LWDFQSLFSDDLGFSGKVTQLSGFRDYLLLRMTPTIIGEGLANFGSGYWVVYVALITGILAALWWLYCSCKERCMPILATIILFLVIAFCRYSVPHGIGSFFFSYFIKIVLSGMVMKAFTWTLSPVLISHR
jgi:hypothetical protein